MAAKKVGLQDQQKTQQMGVLIVGMDLRSKKAGAIVFRQG